MNSVFKSIDNETVELLTAIEPTEITRLTLANTETADTQVLVNLYKNSKTSNRVRITGYNTIIAGYGMLVLTNIYLNAGQYLTLDSNGALDIDINYKPL